MAGKNPIIPIKDLIELHEKAKFPIDGIFLTFKDYDWLAKFFSSCFEQLYAHKQIKYREYLFEDKKYRKYPRGLMALSKFVSEKLGYKNFGIREHLEHKEGASLLVIAFLARVCGRNLGEIQPQILRMYFGKRDSQNVSMMIFCILHNSKIALAPHQILLILEREYGAHISSKSWYSSLALLTNNGYLIKHGAEGAPFYTLCGEERKYKE